MSKTVLIIGGGITGLSAAYYLQKLCKEKQLDHRIILVEKSERLGGKIQTINRDGYVLETGPDSMLKRKTEALDLTFDLLLENGLVGTNPKASAAAILHKGKLHPIPPGFVYGIPTEWKSFIKTGIISTKGKLRAALDLILPDRSSFHDESLGVFFERRFGRELTENVIEPLISGIYAGDTRNLGLMATFP
ncbi:MAG: protoporphyrinogen oxidase, partial [Bacilli bacterium]